MKKPYAPPRLRYLGFDCARCRKFVDTTGSGWVQVRSHGRSFCSMECANQWEGDPENTSEVAASHRAADCPAYAECAAGAMVRDLRPVTPRYTSCDARCPLRPEWPRG